MNCPTCDGETIVVHTNGNERRRECRGDCRQRFTTVEVLKDDHQRLQEAVADVRQVAERLKSAA